MKTPARYINVLLAFCLLHLTLQAQDTIPPVTFKIIDPLVRDSAFTWTFSSYRYFNSIDETIDHYPSPEDQEFVKKNRKLITSLPTRHNYRLYKTMAVSLWDLGRTADAERMFRNIYDSKASYYNSRYRYASDIPGDKGNSYGYGSFVDDYKHYACRYLCMIAIEKGQFDSALQYLVQADTLYPLTYNCGTGYRIYRNKMEGLYSICYKGLGQSQELIRRFLPTCFETHSDNLAWALRQTYSQAYIDSALTAAENSIICIVDTSTSYYTTIENSGKENEKETKVTFTSGTGTIQFFGLSLTLPQPDLKQDEVVTREHYLRLFRECPIYEDLKGL